MCGEGGTRVCPCPLPAPSRRRCRGAPCGPPALGALLPPCSRRARQRSAAPQWKRPPIPVTRSRGTSRARSGGAAPTATGGSTRHAVPGAGGGAVALTAGPRSAPGGPVRPFPARRPPRSRRSGSGRAVASGAAPTAAPGPAPRRPASPRPPPPAPQGDPAHQVVHLRPAGAAPRRARPYCDAESRGLRRAAGRDGGGGGGGRAGGIIPAPCQPGPAGPAPPMGCAAPTGGGAAAGGSGAAPGAGGGGLGDGAGGPIAVRRGFPALLGLFLPVGGTRPPWALPVEAAMPPRSRPSPRGRWSCGRVRRPQAELGGFRSAVTAWGRTGSWGAARLRGSPTGCRPSRAPRCPIPARNVPCCSPSSPEEIRCRKEKLREIPRGADMGKVLQDPVSVTAQEVVSN